MAYESEQRRTDRSVSGISTQTVTELGDAQYFSVGFGDLSASQADLVVVASFREPRFKAGTAVWSMANLFRSIGVDVEADWASAHASGRRFLVLNSRRLQRDRRIPRLAIVDMGRFRIDDPRAAMRLGLDELARWIRKQVHRIRTVDLAALGTRYGGILHTDGVAILTGWCGHLFRENPDLGHVRIVEMHRDRCEQLSEAIRSIRTLDAPTRDIRTGSEIPDGLVELKCAQTVLSLSPRISMASCRIGLERLVRELAFQNRVQDNTLSGSIRALAKALIISGAVERTLHTARVLGNSANHDVLFMPTREDAEFTLALTLRASTKMRALLTDGQPV